MARRFLHFLALVLLVLTGPAQGLFTSEAPQRCCCCGEAPEPGSDRGPCGMPTCPPTRCPPTGASLTAQAPVLLASRVRIAQVRLREPRREPSPWPPRAAMTPRAASAGPARAHGPPLRRFGDPQAELRTFRI